MPGPSLAATKPSRALALSDAIREECERLIGRRPNVDFATVGMRRALGLPLGPQREAVREGLGVEGRHHEEDHVRELLVGVQIDRLFPKPEFVLALHDRHHGTRQRVRSAQGAVFGY